MRQGRPHSYSRRWRDYRTVAPRWADSILGEELGLTGAEASLQRLAAGEDAPFFHSHKTHEEIYVIISGNGEFEVDGEKIQVGEGSIVRISPAGVRALRNTGNEEMVMMCLQYEAKAITSFMEDANNRWLM